MFVDPNANRRKSSSLLSDNFRRKMSALEDSLTMVKNGLIRMSIVDINSEDERNRIIQEIKLKTVAGYSGKIFAVAFGEDHSLINLIDHFIQIGCPLGRIIFVAFPMGEQIDISYCTGFRSNFTSLILDFNYEAVDIAPEKTLKELVKSLLKGEVRKVDLWETEIECDSNHGSISKVREFHGVRKKNTLKETHKTGGVLVNATIYRSYMISFFSIGLSSKISLYKGAYTPFVCCMCCTDCCIPCCACFVEKSCALFKSKAIHVPVKKIDCISKANKLMKGQSEDWELVRKTIYESTQSINQGNSGQFQGAKQKDYSNIMAFNLHPILEEKGPADIFSRSVFGRKEEDRNITFNNGQLEFMTYRGKEHNQVSLRIRNGEGEHVAEGMKNNF